MKIIIDVNLSPRWVEALAARGDEARHWSEIGSLDGEDVTILEWVRINAGVLLTCDLDFGAILAATGLLSPSVVQIRGRDVLPETLAAKVASVLRELEEEIKDGALVSLDIDRSRVRVLPLKG